MGVTNNCLLENVINTTNVTVRSPMKQKTPLKGNVTDIRITINFLLDNSSIPSDTKRRLREIDQNG